MAFMPGDVAAVLRCSPFIVGLPSVVAFVLFEAPRIVAAFDREVRSLLAATVRDGQSRERAARAMLGSSLKVSLAMSCYTTMAGVPFRPDLAVLGSSFTRVYDDVFDNFAQDRLEQRLTALFAGGPFEPTDEAEALLLALYRATEAALQRPRSDPIFRMVIDMHRYQCMSRRQWDPDIALDTVRLITRGKGGLGTAVLFALFKPGMTSAEQNVIVEFGYQLQLLDDLNDADLDLAAGVATEVTLGACTLADVGRRMRTLRRRLDGLYPGTAKRRLEGMLLLMLTGAALQRRRVAGPARPAGRRRRVRGRWLFFAPVETLRPQDTPGPAKE
jgi:hypothetical protein